MNIDYARQLDEYVDFLYGSYMKTVRYDSRDGVICPVCGGFKGPSYPECRSCKLISDTANSLGNADLLADRIAFSVYAIKPNSQTLRVMYGYKDPGPTAAAYRKVVKALLALAIKGHDDCLSRVSELRLAAWAMPPSSQNSHRFGKPHPLHSIIQEVLSDTPEIRLNAMTTKGRNFNPDAFQLMDPHDAWNLRGNVLLIDDAWVTGGTAQSAAAALKRAGAEQVSIYCISRIVDLNFLRGVDPDSVGRFNKFVHYIANYCPWDRQQEVRISRLQ